MPRSPAQTLLNLYVSDGFLHLIDSALPDLGYANRSDFIRSAIREKLLTHGLRVPAGLAAAPNRLGKGGRKRRVDLPETANDPVANPQDAGEPPHREALWA